MSSFISITEIEDPSKTKVVIYVFKNPKIYYKDIHSTFVSSY